MKFSIAFFVAASLAGASALADVSARPHAQPTVVVCSQTCDLAVHAAATKGMVADMGSMAGVPATPPAAAQPGAAQMEPDASMGSMSDDAMQGHMHMSPGRPANAADTARADTIVAALRVAIQPYKDYRVAEAAGYTPFHPEWPLPMYHFVNLQNALANQSSFDPTRPTALMYKRVAGGYELEGAMYTAPRGLTLDELDARVPLSVATWHEHTDLCIPPAGMAAQAFGPNARFGLRGSITTAAACTQAGGTFKPIIYNWMVHVWPFETDATKVWATADDPGTTGH